jgi:pimeloyl-ACP methyl ester carboxylesterase
MKIQYFGGNPGFREDFAKLESFLPSESVGAAVIAYSYGAFEALSKIHRGEIQAERLVLIAPFFKSTEPLGAFAKFLLSIARFRRAIVRKSWRKWQEDFLKRMFGASELSHKEVSSFHARLASESVWQRVVEKKLYQEKHPLNPLPESTKLKVTIIVGSADRICPPARILREAQSLGLEFESVEIPGAEHGMLLTRAEDLAQAIRRMDL